VRSTSPPRRAAGLLAAGATGAAAVLLGFVAPAHATTLNPITISTDSSTTPDQVVTSSYQIPAGYCSVRWTLYGAGGGDGYDSVNGGLGNAGDGGRLSVTTPVTSGLLISLVTGTTGHDGTAAGHGAGGSGAPAGAAGTDELDNSSAIVGGSGGGGGASAVTLGGFSLVARGGTGGLVNLTTTPGSAGGNGASNSINWPGSTTNLNNASSGNYGDGWISGTVNPCVAPGAPTDVNADGGDGSATISFTADSQSYADSWQYSRDGGTWTTVSAPGSGGYHSFTLTGLTNGTTYSFRVRGMNGTTAGDPSAAVSVSPALPNGAPTHVVVTPGSSSYVVTWDAPTTSGTFPIAGYTVGWSGGERGGPLCENVPVTAARRCVGAAVPGDDITVFVVAVDTKDNWGESSDPVSVGAVAAPVVPASPPASADRLVLPAGATSAVAAGATMTLTGSGYLPNSTVSLIIYSTPQVLTTVVTDATGSFTATVTVPAGLQNGSHTLVASGVDPAGNVRYVTLPVTVSGGTASKLPATGFDIVLPLTGGLLAIAVGIALVFVGRRRTIVDGVA
jgi:hypothetical protein